MLSKENYNYDEVMSLDELSKGYSNWHFNPIIKGMYGSTRINDILGIRFPTPKEGEEYIVNYIINRGVELETLIRETVRRQTGWTIEDDNNIYTKKIGDVVAYSAFDGLIDCGEGKYKSLEIKCTVMPYEPEKFIKDQYLIQATIYMGLVGINETVFCIASGLPPFELIEFKFDQELFDLIIELFLELKDKEQQTTPIILLDKLAQVREQYISKTQENYQANLIYDDDFFFNEQKNIKTSITKTRNKLIESQNKLSYLNTINQINRIEEYL